MYFDDTIHIYIAEFSQKFDMKNIVIRYNDLVRIEVCLPGTKYHVTVHVVRICLTFGGGKLRNGLYSMPCPSIELRELW